MTDDEQHEKVVVDLYTDAMCPDGGACAWIASEVYSAENGYDLRIHLIRRGSVEARLDFVKETMTPGSRVVFADNSPEDEILEYLYTPTEGDEGALVRPTSHLTIIDHHGTDSDRITNFVPPVVEGVNDAALEVIFDPDAKSAAELMWSHYFPKKDAPEILSWVGKLENSETEIRTDNEEAVAAYVGSKPLKTPQDVLETFNELAGMPIKLMARQGKAIFYDQLNSTSEAEDDEMYTFLEVAPGHFEWTTIVNAKITALGRAANKAFIRRANLGTGCGIAIIYYMQGNGEIKASIRTDGTPDAGEVAAFVGNKLGKGGGGKDKEAAMFFSREQFVRNVPLFTKEQMKLARYLLMHSATPKAVIRAAASFKLEEVYEKKHQELEATPSPE